LGRSPEAFIGGCGTLGLIPQIHKRFVDRGPVAGLGRGKKRREFRQSSTGRRPCLRHFFGNKGSQLGRDDRIFNIAPICKTFFRATTTG